MVNKPWTPVWLFDDASVLLKHEKPGEPGCLRRTNGPQVIVVQRKAATEYFRLSTCLLEFSFQSGSVYICLNRASVSFIRTLMDKSSFLAKAPIIIWYISPDSENMP